ncbi:ATPase, T2SS/T4P/T4SS family [Thermodesulfobacteriota bacterium]
MTKQKTPVNQDIKNKLAEADLYKSHGLLNEASQVYKSLLEEVDPADAALHKKISRLLADVDQLEESVTHKIKEKEVGTSSPSEVAQHKYETGIGLMEAGFYAEAIEELSSLLTSPIFTSSAIHTIIGECYLSLDDHFQALDHLEKARDAKDLDKGQERLQILERLALLYESTGDFPSAIAAFEDIIKVNPKFRNAEIRLNQLSQDAKKYGRYHFLIKRKGLTAEQLEKAIAQAKKDNKHIDAVLLNKFGIEKSLLGESLSQYYDCPFVEFNELELVEIPSRIEGIKEHFFRANACVPIDDKNGVPVIASENPFDMVKIDNLRMIFKTTDLSLVVAIKDDIDKFIDYYYGKYSIDEQADDLFEQLELVEDTEEDEGPAEETDSHAEGVVVKMVNKIIEDAIRQNASDIHIESLAGRQGSRVRFRSDGDCLQYRNIPYQYKRALVSRIKIISKLDISERRIPQDGKIKFKTRRRKTIELRVATIPTASGFEDVVMRILSDAKALPITAMGLQENNLDLLKSMLELPYGLILVVGPTGSGKTTTLHAALNSVNRLEKKIWTVEDPVEIVQEGLRQVQVNPGIDLTFARVLKAFLRADPDVIMVGETRDEETAKTVIEASLTGHLVFTTLHTNSAPETITRLLGMGLEPFSFADSLIGIVAQRLVKKLCTKCRKKYTTSKSERQAIIEEYGDHPIHPLHPSSLTKVRLYKPAGCSHCNNTGYKGRFAIHEILKVNDGLKQHIEKNSPVSVLREHAFLAGMTTLKQDGILKVIQGETDFKQIRAACIK